MASRTSHSKAAILSSALQSQAKSSDMVVGMWLSMTMWAWVHKASVGLLSSGGTALAACWPGGMLHLLTKTHT